MRKSRLGNATENHHCSPLNVCLEGGVVISNAANTGGNDRGSDKRAKKALRAKETYLKRGWAINRWGYHTWLGKILRYGSSIMLTGKYNTAAEKT